VRVLTVAEGSTAARTARPCRGENTWASTAPCPARRKPPEVVGDGLVVAGAHAEGGQRQVLEVGKGRAARSRIAAARAEYWSDRSRRRQWVWFLAGSPDQAGPPMSMLSIESS